MNWFKITAADTLFFRDGRPFNHGEVSLQAVPSQFPPPVPTLVGALRAALARGLGWSQGPWNDALKSRLGDGDDLGPLTFSGPFLRWRNQDLYPVPAFLLGQKNADGWRSLTLLRPGPPLDCDLGRAVRLPVPVERAEGLKEVERVWLTRQGFERLLSGEAPAPEQLLPEGNLLQFETRIGIGRDARRRAVEEGKLYCTRHVRPAAETCFVCGIANLPDDAGLPNLAPVGGETRMAWVEATEEPKFPPMPGLYRNNNRLLYTVTLLTPGDFKRWPEPGKPFGKLPGRLVSACLRRSEWLGGWDSVKRQPKPLKPLLPAGSVLFMEAELAAEGELAGWHGKSIGNRTAWGFGQILIGTWKEGGQ